jgi:hypothetical protein
MSFHTAIETHIIKMRYRLDSPGKSITSAIILANSNVDNCKEI